MNFTLKDLLELIKRNGSGILENSKAFDNVSTSASLPIKEHANWHPHWVIEKFKDEIAYKNGLSYEVINVDGNLLLQEGITELLTLLIGGTATAFNNINSYIGIGDGILAATPTQTDLQGINILYKPMDVSYPSVLGQTVSFKSTFDGSSANWAWNEITVANASSGVGKNLNRKVQTLGVKASPAIWAITLAITIS